MENHSFQFHQNQSLINPNARRRGGPGGPSGPPSSTSSNTRVLAPPGRSAPESNNRHLPLAPLLNSSHLARPTPGQFPETGPTRISQARSPPRWRYRDPDFFTLGRVFCVIWPERSRRRPSIPAGSSNCSLTSSGLSNPKDAKDVYTERAYFIVIKEQPDMHHCICLRMHTYRGFGLNAKHLSPVEQQAHAVVYSTTNAPDDLIDERTNQPPIAVIPPPESVESLLATESRLHLSQPFTVDTGLLVRNYGLVQNVEMLKQAARPYFELS